MVIDGGIYLTLTLFTELCWVKLSTVETGCSRRSRLRPSAENSLWWWETENTQGKTTRKTQTKRGCVCTCWVVPVSCRSHTFYFHYSDYLALYQGHLIEFYFVIISIIWYLKCLHNQFLFPSFLFHIYN